MTDENADLIELSRALADVTLPCIYLSGVDGCEIDWIPLARWVHEREAQLRLTARTLQLERDTAMGRMELDRRERSETIELLAKALDVSRPFTELHVREGVLKFLAEELVATHERLLELFANEHGGKPEQGPSGDHWHLTWQFTADVWDEHTPLHRLNTRVVALNRGAVAAFVVELRDWIAFIETSVLESTGKGTGRTYEDPTTRECFALQWDEQDECDALLHAFEDHELTQVGTAGADGICIWDEHANFSVPWPIIEQAARRCRARERVIEQAQRQKVREILR